MAYFLFIDESGQDHHNSPYEVLAGFAIRDIDLWEFIQRIHLIEYDCFGRTYREDRDEIKATKFLKKKTFRLAAQLPPIPQPERRILAKEILDDGSKASKKGLTALAQAKLDYVKRVLKLCREYKCNAFASIVCNPKTLPLNNTLLRRDYVYLFERFFYFLDDRRDHPQGIVVFDELDKTKSHLLLSQMDKYFKNTHKGRERACLIIPEPFFVHSDLTTGIQIVDFIAYIISWNFRVKKLGKPKREELNGFMSLVAGLRYRSPRKRDGKQYYIWSFTAV